MSSGAHKSKVNKRNRRLPTWRDEAVRAIEAAGGKIDSRGEFEPGAPYVFARDPDGHVIEIWYETGDSGSAETP